MTPFTVAYVESVVNGIATYRVAWVYDGRHREAPVGPSFSKPRDAARYARRLEGRTHREAA